MYTKSNIFLNNLFYFHLISLCIHSCTPTNFHYEIETAIRFDDHYSTVWHLAWNISGTVLASSGDDGIVRLYDGKF